MQMLPSCVGSSPGLWQLPPLADSIGKGGFTAWPRLQGQEDVADGLARHGALRTLQPDASFPAPVSLTGSKTQPELQVGEGGWIQALLG